MKEKKTETQNIQMVRTENHEEDPSVNVVTVSGVTTNEDKGNKISIDVWMHKSLENKEVFNLQCTKYAFIEAQKEFAEGSTSTSGRTLKAVGGDEEIKPFLQECINLLRTNKAIEKLQELIYNCAEKEQPMLEQRVVNKIYKNKKRIGREMCMTMQIVAYEMDQVILDLGSDANFLPKQTWQHMAGQKL